ncbi:hypothetical protein FM069_01450 [Pseudomonas mangiferae]|uniref:Uncharacterized protein n=1 Tax=Pseudomonas mangiferae TaxID=2593654 RepID=A0A553H4K9_9PSED|nr:hypothetical protein FM069_01405 [Pseudomonas mangiferae]TRX76713.1 hypothetical protein FM069_01450 [Pseudomonas mangiferae]
MNFLGCDGVWLIRDDKTTICQGQMKTFTVQEMRDFLTPALTWAQRAEITSALLALFVAVWVIKAIRSVF